MSASTGVVEDWGESVAELHFCKCGIRVVLCTAWTETNPGRRFESCSMYKKEDIAKQGCDYFRWYEEKLSEERMRQIIMGLLRKKNKLEQEVGAMKARHKRLSRYVALDRTKMLRQNRWLFIGLLITWAFIIVVVLM